MVQSNWRSRIGEACSEAEVMRVVRDYLATWHPLERARLPAACNPPPMFDADGLNSYLVDLMRFDPASRPASADALRDLVAFFSAASQRLAVLMAVRGDAPARTRYFAER
jgi:hypothetical protein